MAAKAQTSFADTISARFIALCIAVLLASILYLNYSDDFQQLFAGETENGLPVTTATISPDEAANPALASCLKQRIGDVDRMKEEGILSDAQYSQFRQRAEELCFQQNPG